MPVLKEMTEQEKKLFGIFKRAVEAEQEAQVMYREAAALCTNPAMKTVLEGFVADEARHEREILARYRQFREEFAVSE